MSAPLSPHDPGLVARLLFWLGTYGILLRNLHDLSVGERCLDIVGAGGEGVRGESHDLFPEHIARVSLEMNGCFYMVKPDRDAS